MKFRHVMKLSNIMKFRGVCIKYLQYSLSEFSLYWNLVIFIKNYHYCCFQYYTENLFTVSQGMPANAYTRQNKISVTHHIIMEHEVKGDFKPICYIYAYWRVTYTSRCFATKSCLCGWVLTDHVTSLHLRSKEFINTHKRYMPYSSFPYYNLCAYLLHFICATNLYNLFVYHCTNYL